MELFDAREMAEAKLVEHKLSAWTLEFSNTKHRGDCNYNKQRIRLSRPFVEANSPERVLQTVLHEIAHALTWINNRHAKPHGIEWQTIAKQIGHTGERCIPAESYTTGRAKTLYTGHCPNCNREVKKYRRREIACGKCCRAYNGGKFTKRFKIVW